MNAMISIVVPAFDESARLGDSIQKIAAYLEREIPAAELIVVDDGSDDDTAKVAEKSFAAFPNMAAKIIRYEKNRGKGFAVRTGLAEAKGDIALFSDADLSTPITELPKLVAPIQNGEFDVTFGSRALDRSLIGTHQPWRREQSGKIFNLIVRILTGLPFWDTQGGFKAFNMTKFRPLLPMMQIDRFGFDVEFLYVAYQNKLRLKETPVRWNDVAGSKISFIKGLPAFAEVDKIRRNAKKGLYNENRRQKTKDGK
ncbi:MAG: dolichyl-phosphate beta-glucosyltransferase [Pyrinomonadaceae bacterium]